MQVGSISGAGCRYQAAAKRQVSDVKAYPGAVTAAAAERTGMFLSSATVPEEGQSTVYGLRAVLLDRSSYEKPIVQVISSLNGKKEVFDIDISQVDPKNATRMEMFALCSFADSDSAGPGTGSSFGSFKTLKLCGETAKQDGYMEQADASESTWEQFRTEKKDWIGLTEQVCDKLKAVIDPKALDLFSKGKKLLGMFEKYSDMASSVAGGIDVQYMNVIQGSVCSLPNAGISFYYTPSTGVLDCVDDTSPQEGRTVLWSKVVPEEDYDRCSVLFERYQGARTWEYKYEAYLAHEDFWDMYLNHGFDTEALDAANKQLIDKQLFERLLQNCPEAVKEAWKDAWMEAGNVFTADEAGKVTYFSELYKQVFANAVNGNAYGVLGNSEEDAIEFARSAIDRLNRAGGYNYSTQHMREREMEFYKVFLNNLTK